MENNAILVSTKHTDGKAWFAWRIAEENRESLKYVVGDNQGLRSAFAIRDSAECYINDEPYKRVAFALEDISHSRKGQVLLSISWEHTANTGVVYFDFDDARFR